MKHAKFLSGAAYFLLALPLFYFSGTMLLPAVMAIIASCCVYEALRVTDTEQARALTVPSIALAVCASFSVYASPLFFRLAFALYLLYALLVFFVGFERFSLQLAFYIVGITALLSVGISSAVLSRRLGLWPLVLTFVGTWTSDTTAQYCGRLFGRHKLGSPISPNKTVEGCVGSLLCTALVFCLSAVLLKSRLGLSCNPMLFALLGLFVSVAGQLGDLLGSAIKRTFHVKDFGKLIPGHGGMYDRFDSFALVAPLVYMVFDALPIT